MNGDFILALALATGIICAILFVFFIRNLINNMPPAYLVKEQIVIKHRKNE